MPALPPFGDDTLRVYSDIFEDVISKDESFGPTLRKVKTVYDAFLKQVASLGHTTPGAARTPHGKGHDSGSATPTPPLAPWGLSPGGDHRVAPGGRLEPVGPGPGPDSGQGSEELSQLRRENRELKALVKRLRQDLEVVEDRARVQDARPANCRLDLSSWKESWPRSGTPLDTAAMTGGVGCPAGQRPLLPGRGGAGGGGSVSALEATARSATAGLHECTRSSASPARNGLYTPPMSRAPSHSELARNPLAGDRRHWTFSEAQREPDLSSSPSPQKRRAAGSLGSAAPPLLAAFPGHRGWLEPPQPPEGRACGPRSPSLPSKGASVSPSRRQGSGRGAAAAGGPLGAPVLEEALPARCPSTGARAPSQQPPRRGSSASRHEDVLDSARSAEDSPLPQRPGFGHALRPSSVPRLNLVAVSLAASRDGSDEESEESEEPRERDDEDEASEGRESDDDEPLETFNEREVGGAWLPSRAVAGGRGGAREQDHSDSERRVPRVLSPEAAGTGSSTSSTRAASTPPRKVVTPTPPYARAPTPPPCAGATGAHAHLAKLG